VSLQRVGAVGSFTDANDRYTNVGEYRGSWLDWQKQGGPGTKSPSEPDGMGEPKQPLTETKPTQRTGDSGEEDLGPQGRPEYPPGPGDKGVL
jgi:hypothetical protein